RVNPLYYRLKRARLCFDKWLEHRTPGVRPPIRVIVLAQAGTEEDARSMGSIPVSPGAISTSETSDAPAAPVLTVPGKPTVVIRPRSRWQPVHLGELWR